MKYNESRYCGGKVVVLGVLMAAIIPVGIAMPSNWPTCSFWS